MNLKKKKELAKKTLKVSKKRIIFLAPRLNEIKDAITKQDIKELQKEGAIVINPPKGRRKIEKRKRKRGVGKIKKKVNKRKRNYVILTRKLRKYISELQKRGKMAKKLHRSVYPKLQNEGAKKDKSKENGKKGEKK